MTLTVTEKGTGQIYQINSFGEIWTRFPATAWKRFLDKTAVDTLNELLFKQIVRERDAAIQDALDGGYVGRLTHDEALAHLRKRLADRG